MSDAVRINFFMPRNHELDTDMVDPVCCDEKTNPTEANLTLVGVGTAVHVVPNLPHKWQKTQITEGKQRTFPVRYNDLKNGIIVNPMHRCYGRRPWHVIVRHSVRPRPCCGRTHYQSLVKQRLTVEKVYVLCFS